jgi:hypothetical protein
MLASGAEATGLASGAVVLVTYERSPIGAAGKPAIPPGMLVDVAGTPGTPVGTAGTPVTLDGALGMAVDRPEGAPTGAGLGAVAGMLTEAPTGKKPASSSSNPCCNGNPSRDG